MALQRFIKRGVKYINKHKLSKEIRAMYITGPPPMGFNYCTANDFPVEQREAYKVMKSWVMSQIKNYKFHVYSIIQDYLHYFFTDNTMPDTDDESLEFFDLDQWGLTTAQLQHRLLYS